MKLLKTAWLSLNFWLLSVGTAVAQDDIRNSVGSVSPNATPFTSLGNLITSLLQLVYYGAGLLFFINLLVGGIQWITSGGDKAGVQSARDRIVNSLIGLVIVVGAYAITLIVQQVLGIKILTGFNFRPPTR